MNLRITNNATYCRITAIDLTDAESSKWTAEEKIAKESAKEWGVNSGFLRDRAGRKRGARSEFSPRISRGSASTP